MWLWSWKHNSVRTQVAPSSFSRLCLRLVKLLAGHLLESSRIINTSRIKVVQVKEVVQVYRLYRDSRRSRRRRSRRSRSRRRRRRRAVDQSCFCCCSLPSNVAAKRQKEKDNTKITSSQSSEMLLHLKKGKGQKAKSQEDKESKRQRVKRTCSRRE